MGSTTLQIYLISIFFQITNSSIPKEYLDSLLSNHFFKGYDLIISVEKDSEGIVPWYYKHTILQDLEKYKCMADFFL